MIIVSKPKISCNIVWTLKKIPLRGGLGTGMVDAIEKVAAAKIGDERWRREITDLMDCLLWLRQELPQPFEDYKVDITTFYTVWRYNFYLDIIENSLFRRRIGKDGDGIQLAMYAPIFYLKVKKELLAMELSSFCSSAEG